MPSFKQEYYFVLCEYFVQVVLGKAALFTNPDPEKLES